MSIARRRGCYNTSSPEPFLGHVKTYDLPFTKRFCFFVLVLVLVLVLVWEGNKAVLGARNVTRTRVVMNGREWTWGVGR